MSKKLKFLVTSEYDNHIAQNFLKGKCGLSSRIITLLKREKDGILMDGKILRTVDKVYEGKVVEISLPSEKTTILPISGQLDIAYEDDYFLICNKPYDMPVHPVKQHQLNTLANIVSFYQLSKNEEYVYRAVNRLDKNTSGLVMIAKNRFVSNSIKNNVDKTYLALCEGKLFGEGTIDLPIGLKSDSIIVREVRDDGARAVTHYKALKEFENYTLVELWLETGRTHQIRCHMSHIGHPLLGDDLYGGGLSLIKRQALHCATMKFIHPILQKEIFVSSSLPEDMSKLVL